MRIPTGNFGNVLPQANPTRVSVGNADAVGNAITGFGVAAGQVAERIQQEDYQIARAKAATALNDDKLTISSVIDDIHQQAREGKITSSQMEQAYDSAVQGLQRPEVDGLDPVAIETFGAGLQQNVKAGLARLRGIASAVRIDENKAATTAFADSLGKLINQPGANPDALAAQLDAADSQGRIGWGAGWGKVKQTLKDNLYASYVGQQLIVARDSYGGLQNIIADLSSDKGRFIDKLDPEKRKALLNQAMGYQARIEARAIAAQNHADMLALRRENAAIHASSTMQMRIANGEIPTDQDWNSYLTSVSGTSQDGTAPVLRSALLETQRLYSLPPEQAQAQVDSLALSLKKNGGSEIQYKVLNAVQSNIDHRRTQLQKNPQAVFAMDSGVPLEQLNPQSALQQPGEWGASLAQRQANSDAITQKYGATAGKNLLTTEELGNAKDAYEKMSPDQRIQFWRNTQASSTPAIASRLAREIGGDALQVSAVAGLASNPAGYKTALAVENGSRLLNPVDGAPKVRLPASFDQDVATKIKSSYPSLSPAQVQRLVPVVRDYHIGNGGSTDTTPKAEDLYAVIGKPVNIYGSVAVAPAGADENTFIDALKTGVNRLGDSAQDVKNGLSQGVYGFVSDSDGNQVLINAATQRRVVGKDGKPIVIGVTK
ncbi:hypothetical protein IU821_003422 [Salmonella enterica]|nr:hypothetical protein [Salmonella enterica]